MAKGKKITIVTEEILKEFLENEGLLLYDVEYVKEGPDRVLRVYIDKEEGFVGTEDCEKVSKFLSDKLDELDPIEDNYLLEVSSPGLDRELKRDEHFAANIGNAVDVSLYEAIDGEKQITGKLVKKDEESLTIDIDGKIIDIPFKQITKVNLSVTI